MKIMNGHTKIAKQIFVNERPNATILWTVAIIHGIRERVRAISNNIMLLIARACIFLTYRNRYGLT